MPPGHCSGPTGLEAERNPLCRSTFRGHELLCCCIVVEFSCGHEPFRCGLFRGCELFSCGHEPVAFVREPFPSGSCATASTTA